MNRNLLFQQLTAVAYSESHSRRKFLAREFVAAIEDNRSILTEELRDHMFEEIRRRLFMGEPFGKIANVLNNQGFRGTHGGRWYGSSVRALCVEDARQETARRMRNASEDGG